MAFFDVRSYRLNVAEGFGEEAAYSLSVRKDVKISGFISVIGGGRRSLRAPADFCIDGKGEEVVVRRRP